MKKTAIVDLRTEKIYGAEKGTHSYYHEEGHLVYNKSELGVRNRLLQGYLIDTIIISIMATFIWEFFLWLSLTLFIAYKGFDIYEERYAERYAKNKINENGRDQDSETPD